MKIKKVISLAMCLILLLTTVFVPGVDSFAAEQAVEIRLKDEKIETLTLEEHQKEVLAATVQGMVFPSYQWQILIDEETQSWVDIYDKKESECEISYPVVKHAMDEKGNAYIRCVVEKGANQIYSDIVHVIIKVDTIEEQSSQVTSFSQTRYVATTDASPSKAVSGPAGGSRAVNSDLVTITIKYLDVVSLKDGEAESAIYSPYTATIEKGKVFSQGAEGIISPTFIGFAPYLDSNQNGRIDDGDTKADIVYVPNEPINEDLTICVYYKPIPVNYSVKYYFQNIHDDLYTEDPNLQFSAQAETGTIIKNEFLEEKGGNPEGFTKMYHIPESVAADGSTVFECYYDRNYYMVQFDLDGGYGVDPIYARYGTPFVVNDPVKHGYAFAGWKLVAVDPEGDGTTRPPNASEPSGMVSTIPAANYYYQAQWQHISTTYTVVYWLGDNAGGYDYVKSQTMNATSGDPVSGGALSSPLYICGEDGTHTHIDGCKAVFEKADQNVIVEGDGSTVVNVYYQPKKYKLRFYYAAEYNGKVQIIGGSSYPFGANGSQTDDDRTLLNGIFTKTEGVGEVTKLPELNDRGEKRNYTKESISYNNRTYHYLEFEAGYGQDISELWPCDVFEPATRSNTSNKNGWSGDKAIVSAWNGEYCVWYSHHGPLKTDYTRNQTVKGNYEKLDYKILFDGQFNDAHFVTDPNTVSFLCFWENGAHDITWNIPELYVYRLWAPVLPGESTDGLTTTVYDGKPYKLLESYNTCDDSRVEEQTECALEGYIFQKKVGTSFTSSMTPEQKLLYNEAYYVDFYYTQEASHSFTMKNYDSNIVEKNGVPYSTKLASIPEVGAALNDKLEPPYPTKLETGAYYFDGWYTTEQFLPGTKYELADGTMPESGLILYAKWTPKTHKVNFFKSYDEMKAFEEDSTKPTYASKDVLHGQTAGAIDTPTIEDTSGMGLIFAGWFYMENGEKKAYAPLSFPVNRDLNIFAEWSSHSPQPYKISYVLDSDTSVKVADDTTGYAYGGTTRTFNAKAGDPYNQLYNIPDGKNYNIGYFPTTASHSITIQADDKENPSKNIFTFKYVNAEDIEYKVRYVNKKTGAELVTTKEADTNSAVVTERFVAIENYVPDAFYKELVLEVVWDPVQNKYVGSENNVITFYYTPNTTSAYYAVHFMVEKLGATDVQKTQYNIDGTGGYKESGTHIEGIGTVGSKMNIAPQNISGFTLLENSSVPQAVVPGKGTSKATKVGDAYSLEITEDGSELYFFYSRNQYNYTVNYFEYNTTKALNPTKTGTAPFESDVTETAPTISGYNCVTAESRTIKIVEDADGTKNNVITFYYSPVQYIADYVVMSDPGSGLVKDEIGGTLSQTSEVATGSKVLLGSKPTAKSYYEFNGWYLDEACTVSADDKGTIDSLTNHFIPDKAKMSDKNRNTYYAKFVRKANNLIITREDTLKDGQVYVYQIKNNNTGEIYYATIAGDQYGGNKSVTVYNLPHGNYTVTQQNSWSWRYTDAAVVQDFTGDDTVTFGAEPSRKWLNGHSMRWLNKRK